MKFSDIFTGKAANPNSFIQTFNGDVDVINFTLTQKETLLISGEFNNSSRENNILGIGVFEVGDSFEFSDVSDSLIGGVLDNTPTGGSCFAVCRESIGNAKGLRLLIFRHPTGSRDIMWSNSSRMQNLSNQGNVPVILRDAYFNKSFIWRPESNEN